MSVEMHPIPTDIALSPQTRRSRAATGLVAGGVVSALIFAAVWLLAAVIPDKTGSPFAPVRDFCAWLAGTRIGLGLLESIYAFPIVEGLHLIGIALSIGILCWFDLRLLGLILTDIPVSRVWRQMMPLAGLGFALVFATGLLLFAAEAVTAYDSVHFWIKIGLILLAGANAAFFEIKVYPTIADWDDAALPPRRARIAGLLSLVFWTAVIITGRTMAYSF